MKALILFSFLFVETSFSQVCPLQLPGGACYEYQSQIYPTYGYSPYYSPYFSPIVITPYWEPANLELRYVYPPLWQQGIYYSAPQVLGW